MLPSNDSAAGTERLSIVGISKERILEALRRTFLLIRIGKFSLFRFFDEGLRRPLDENASRPDEILQNHETRSARENRFPSYSHTFQQSRLSVSREK